MIRAVFKVSLFFFFLFSLSCSSRAQPQVPSDFYQGLASAEKDKALFLFEKALDASNAHIRQAAAEQLAVLLYEGEELSPKTTERMIKEAQGAWAEAFDAVGNPPSKEKALALFLKLSQGRGSPGAPSLYAFRECIKRDEGFFNRLEMAAINGHFAISRSRYGEALVFFRVFKEENNWPAEMPPLFAQYPDLINDLGRAFQYGSLDGEGIDCFLQWEKNLSDEDASLDGLRFRLLFYAGRIARQRGNAKLMENLPEDLFGRALPFAPDDEQADAAAWYVLDITLNRGYESAVEKLERLAPLWRDGAYFDDILERIARELVAKNDWKTLIKVFTIIRGRGAPVSTARYTWIIGRAIEEGLLSPEEMRQAGTAANLQPQSVYAQARLPMSRLKELSVDYKRAAYEAGDTSLYYRCLSAAALEKPFLVLNNAHESSKKNAEKLSDAMEFLLGFFIHNVPEFSTPYIKSMEKDLTPEELRALAEALGKAGMRAESMRLVSLYINKENYKPAKRDFELWFPRPYEELVQKYADETGISQALLYGLIRTESAFQSGVVSHAGAIGLTQLMPATAEEMAASILKAGGPDYAASARGIDLTDPGANIHIGAYYLAFLMTRFEDGTLALLAYNGGINRIRRWKAASALPPDLFLESIALSETREYGRKVTAAAAVYRQLYE